MLGRASFATIVVVTALAGHVAGLDDCTPTSADPSTYLAVTAEGRTFYIEERGSPFGVPIPLGSYLFGPDTNGDGVPEFGEGQKTWIYEEVNTVGGLQRGSSHLVLYPPGCDQNPEWKPTDGTLPCLFVDDPITDEYCGAVPDQHWA